RITLERLDVAVSFKAPPRPVDYSLSLHDALPIFRRLGSRIADEAVGEPPARASSISAASKSRSLSGACPCRNGQRGPRRRFSNRSEEHTSELQSPYDLVCRLLPDKKTRSSCDQVV